MCGLTRDPIRCALVAARQLVKTSIVSICTACKITWGRDHITDAIQEKCVKKPIIVSYLTDEKVGFDFTH